jgi:tetratricopeptide (TPR) repeat protein
MIGQMVGDRLLPMEVMQKVVATTDGVPLFVEELTKMVVELGLVKESEGRYELAGPLPSLAIPATLHDSLMARLDRLGSAKQVAQLGAVVGREFAYEVLQAVAPIEEAILQQGLAHLVETELLYPRGLPPQARYLFKHALIQESAYQSLLHSTRRQYHQQIAQVLEEGFPETRETQPELLAHHYTEADLGAQAIPYWQQAGQRAIERSANIEAISHLTKGLELLKSLPETLERHQQELTLQLAIGSPLLMAKGHTAPEVECAYSRARELCQQVGDNRQLFLALLGLRRFYSDRGDSERVQELVEQLLRLAQSLQDPIFLSQAQSIYGMALFHLGKFVSAREHLEQGIALYAPQKHYSRTFLYGIDPGVLCLCYTARVLWFLGYPDQALRKNHEALTLAQQLSHGYTLGCALHFAAALYAYRREAELVQELAEAIIALSNEHGFIRFLASGMIRRGWALAMQGAVEEGIRQLHQGLDTWQAKEGRLQHLVMLADAYRKVGKEESGLRMLAEAATVLHNSTERDYEAELYRVKGELVLQQAVGRADVCTAPLEISRACVRAIPTSLLPTEAETCFYKALNVACGQRAKSLELRAVMSLCRLWQKQDKCAEARQTLTRIYSWFTEGFDTPDLQEAQALLDTLQ